MTPPTPAMTAQEALAILRANIPTRLVPADMEYERVADQRYINALGTVEDALSDAERRATEADGAGHVVAVALAEGARLKAELAAVEARCGLMEGIIIDCAQFLDGVKPDAVREGWWSEWDQSVRDRITKFHLSILAYPGGKSEETTATETQASISAWCEATFGPASTNARVASRANEEMAELLKALTKNDADTHAVEEAADIVIILYRLAARMGMSLHAEIDRKMAVNRKREWNVGADGHGYHVKSGEHLPGGKSDQGEKA